ncbi:hypothetical protein BH24ACT26_BH24ACT26_08920 [soil metagenome]
MPARRTLARMAPHRFVTATPGASYYLFEQELELPFAIGGAGHGGRAHASGEYATVQGSRDHMHQSLAFLAHLAAAGGFEHS